MRDLTAEKIAQETYWNTAFPKHMYVQILNSNNSNFLNKIKELSKLLNK